MRALVSVLLLMAQLQPLAGMALCRGLAAAEPGLMEDGCPMPESAPGQVSERVTDPSSSSILPSTGSLHDCGFAGACLNASPAVIPAKVAFRTVPPPHEQSLRVVGTLHGSDEFPPPIPPPNS